MLKFYFTKGSIEIYEEPTETIEFNAVVYPFIRKICNEYAGNFNKEEIESEALCGLIEAYNAYSEKFQVLTFEEYAQERIIKAIHAFKKKQSHLITIQSNFSLNQTCVNDSQAESFFYHPANSFENSITFRLFLQSLEGKCYFICMDYIDGLSDKDIIAKYSFQENEFLEKKTYIQQKLIEYIDAY